MEKQRVRVHLNENVSFEGILERGCPWMGWTRVTPDAGHIDLPPMFEVELIKGEPAGFTFVPCSSPRPGHDLCRCNHSGGFGHEGDHRGGGHVWPAVSEEVSHVVTDSSDDPEHIDDCPGCEALDAQSDR